MPTFCRAICRHCPVGRLIFWLDAQLPPSLAPWLEQCFAVKALPANALGLRDAEDRQIYQQARLAGDAVVISKDSDFIEMLLHQGPAPRILWLTCGNTSNRRLPEVFTKTFSEALHLLEAGESIVEIADASAQSITAP